jgi:hypothetical protein
MAGPELEQQNAPDRVQVPDGAILVITEDDSFSHLPRQLIQPLKGQFRRDWFVKHAYHCLPLVIGSQLGFLVKALYDFTVEWDGGQEPESTRITAAGVDEAMLQQQIVTSRFGMGTVTIQNRWTFRTSPGINLLTVSPPNYYLDGITHMVAAVETDNLRRDFTFNLKITRKNFAILIPAGTPIGCLLPYPRHFVDHFRVVNAGDALGAEVIETERQAARLLGQERQTDDLTKPHGIGGRYWRGEDVYGNKFADHQLRLDSVERGDP